MFLKYETKCSKYTSINKLNKIELKQSTFSCEFVHPNFWLSLKHLLKPEVIQNSLCPV